MARDTQRQRLYDSEHELPRGKEYVTVKACERRVAQIIASKFWRDRSSKRHVSVHNGAGHRRAVSYGGTIALPKWARCEVVILHELAHEINARGEKHGPVFARTFYDMLVRFMGADVGALFLVECATRNVKVHGKRLPRSRVTEDHRAAAAVQREARQVRFVVHCDAHGANPSKVGYCVQCRNG